MIYQSVSIKEQIARVIRNTRVQDTSYILDMKEWIGEAMGIMKTKFVLSPRWQDVDIRFHKGKLPIDLDFIEAVECYGHRIPQGNSVRNLDAPHEDLSGRGKQIGTTNGFEFVPQFYDTPPKTNPQENSHIFTQDLTSCMNLPEHHNSWYTLDIIGYINCSIRNTRLRIHYKAIPCDEDGMPLIPDNEDYKQAIQYYCRAMMIGAGFKDTVFSYDKIMGPGGYFEVHAARAIGQITYPSVESMEFKLNGHTRLLKDENYFHNFFDTSHPEPKYGFNEYMDNLSPNGGRTFLNKPTQ